MLLWLGLTFWILVARMNFNSCFRSLKARSMKCVDSGPSNCGVTATPRLICSKDIAADMGSEVQRLNRVKMTTWVAAKEAIQ